MIPALVDPKQSTLHSFFKKKVARPTSPAATPGAAASGIAATPGAAADDDVVMLEEEELPDLGAVLEESPSPNESFTGF